MEKMIDLMEIFFYSANQNPNWNPKSPLTMLNKLLFCLKKTEMIHNNRFLVFPLLLFQ